MVLQRRCLRVLRITVHAKLANQKEKPREGIGVRLFRYADKQGAGQFPVFTDERCIVGLVASTKNGRWPAVGAFFD